MGGNNDNLSRADQIRARRKIESVRKNPVSSQSTRDERNAQNSGRVIARRSVYTPVHDSNTSRQQARKRVYMSAGTEGTEVRLPALPNVRIGWRFLSALITVVAAGALLYMAISNDLRISNVNLAGAQRVSAEEIIRSITVGGLPIVEVVPTEIEKSILATFSEIGSAKVTVEFPNIVNVIVSERQPLIAWLKEDQVSLWIDKDGYSFNPRGDSTGLLAVHSTGEPPHPLGWVDPKSITYVNPDEADTSVKPSVDQAFVHAVEKLSTILPEGTNLLHKPDTGLGWNDPNGWQVYFGSDSEKIDQKLIVYETIVDSILVQNLHPVMISMEFLHAPYYRLEQ
ncbi:MAG: FtsQ-type POTRA domain-containing protein [Anaerolineaceae bacterium]